MSDITDRLRKNTEGSHLWWAKLHTEAADTIDRLQTTADNLREVAEMRVRAHADEIDRLRVTNKMLQDDKAALRETQAKFGQVQHDLLSQIDALREQLALAEAVRAAQVAGLTEGAEKLREALREVIESPSVWDHYSIARAALRGKHDPDQPTAQRV